jgi:hypothetical protein
VVNDGVTVANSRMWSRITLDNGDDSSYEHIHKRGRGDTMDNHPKPRPFASREADFGYEESQNASSRVALAFDTTCLYRIDLLLIPGTPRLGQLGTRDKSPRLTRISHLLQAELEVGDVVQSEYHVDDR